MKRSSRFGLKGIRVLLASLALLQIAVVQAQFTFVTNNGALTIYRYTGLGGEVDIPSTTNGLPITSIGDSAFYFCRSLTKVTIGNNVTNIGNEAFRYCTNLAGAAMGANVVRIGSFAFHYCTSLSSVTIPDSVASVGDYAFLTCRSLTNVAIGNSVTNIGIETFSYCTSLTAITMDALNSFYCSVDGVLFDRSTNTLIRYPGGKAGSYTVPDSVTRIERVAFRTSTSLTSVTIGNSVTNIGDWAFDLCASLTAITIPNSVTRIGGGAFHSCNSLTSVMIGNGVTSIEGGAFSSCTSLTGITIPNSVTSIGDGAFDSCTNLASVTMGTNVTNIGNSAFSSCTSLTGITIPNSVTSIGDGVFSSCTSLTNVTIGNGVTNIGSYVFRYCTNQTAIIVDALNSFYRSVEGVLFNKSANTLIQCPPGKAGNYRVPDSVTSIGSWAFSYCINLTGITIPNSVTNIGSYAFSYCTSLTAITVDTLNSFYCSVGGVLFNKSTNTLIQCPAGKVGNYTVPPSVTSIQDLAFAYCTDLKGVYFRGNAPNMYSLYVFSDATNVIVYYLPGTTGWWPTLCYRPTALWLPHVLSGDGSFGIRTNQFGFNLSWASGMNVAVDACTNPANPVWTPLQTNTLSGDTLYFSDPQWTNHPARFYRLRWP